MAEWTQVCYRYDGSFDGFLTCVFESYVNHERPVAFFEHSDGRFSLWPERVVETCQPHARRVEKSLWERLSPAFRQKIRWGFLTCLQEKELALWELIALGYQQGASVLRQLANPVVARVDAAVRFLGREAHLFKGFTRFSDMDGILVGEIEPKNRVLPLLRPHFCARLSGEQLILHDKTHGEALFYVNQKGAILPVEDFHMGPPGEEERRYRAMWKRFYDTIAIEGRYNPKCRMTQMPKRYWGMMTEFQEQERSALP